MSSAGPSPSSSSSSASSSSFEAPFSTSSSSSATASAPVPIKRVGNSGGIPRAGDVGAVHSSAPHVSHGQSGLFHAVTLFHDAQSIFVGLSCVAVGIWLSKLGGDNIASRCSVPLAAFDVSLGVSLTLLGLCVIVLDMTYRAGHKVVDCTTFVLLCVLCVLGVVVVCLLIWGSSETFSNNLWKIQGQKGGKDLPCDNGLYQPNVFVVLFAWAAIAVLVTAAAIVLIAAGHLSCRQSARAKKRAEAASKFIYTDDSANDAQPFLGGGGGAMAAAAPSGGGLLAGAKA